MVPVKVGDRSSAHSQGDDPHCDCQEQVHAARHWSRLLLLCGIRLLVIEIYEWDHFGGADGRVKPRG
jgi:hypothetical protein